jgi:hypothetical protein
MFIRKLKYESSKCIVGSRFVALLANGAAFYIKKNKSKWQRSSRWRKKIFPIFFIEYKNFENAEPPT